MTRQCPLFHETVLAEWRCVVIQVLFNASYHTVFNVDNLVCLAALLRVRMDDILIIDRS